MVLEVCYRTRDLSLGSGSQDAFCHLTLPCITQKCLFIYLFIYFQPKESVSVLLFASGIHPAILLLYRGSDSSIFARDLCVKHRVAQA